MENATYPSVEELLRHAKMPPIVMIYDQTNIEQGDPRLLDHIACNSTTQHKMIIITKQPETSDRCPAVTCRSRILTDPVDCAKTVVIKW